MVDRFLSTKGSATTRARWTGTSRPCELPRLHGLRQIRRRRGTRATRHPLSADPSQPPLEASVGRRAEIRAHGQKLLQTGERRQVCRQSPRQTRVEGEDQGNQAFETAELDRNRAGKLVVVEVQPAQAVEVAQFRRNQSLISLTGCGSTYYIKYISGHVPLKICRSERESFLPYWRSSDSGGEIASDQRGPRNGLTDLRLVLVTPGPAGTPGGWANLS